jgi:hypothetical protein
MSTHDHDASAALSASVSAFLTQFMAIPAGGAEIAVMGSFSLPATYDNRFVYDILWRNAPTAGAI